MTSNLTGGLPTDLALYRLTHAVREPFLEAIAERIRTHIGDRASRRYRSVLRIGRRLDRRASPIAG